MLAALTALVVFVYPPAVLPAPACPRQAREQELQNKLMLRDAITDAVTARLAPALNGLAHYTEENAQALDVANDQLHTLRLHGRLG